MSDQIAVRLPDGLSASLDELVEVGEFPTKAAAVRTAIEELVERHNRLRVGQQIADGYRRVPQTDEEVARARAAAIASIEEEPWGEVDR